MYPTRPEGHAHSEADEAITAVFFKVHHVPPPAHIVPRLRQTYWMMGSDKVAFENWVRTMTAMIDGSFVHL